MPARAMRWAVSASAFRAFSLMVQTGQYPVLAFNDVRQLLQLLHQTKRQGQARLTPSRAASLRTLASDRPSLSAISLRGTLPAHSLIAATS